MAGLFKNKIVSEKIERLDIPDFEQKIALVQSWYKAYQKGELQLKNETQCEQAFNQDFFINVLGYTAFPNETYTIQPKDNVETGGGQMPDATLGYFKGTNKRVVAVVEIKDANTPLDKAQRRDGNLSPIQQAFKYKPQYKECGFVIATNFYEIRLFRDNQLDYEKFTLTDLVDPANDYFNFRKFYFLLCVQNFVKESGETVTEKLLADIRIEQEKITNKFYREYKELREDLIKDIVENNSIKQANFYAQVVEKAQKIVDRLVFVCFFEDAGLLPQNKLLEVVEYAKKSELDIPIWDTLKLFFKAVDEGSDKLGVPNGYNGELFKNDDKLNNLKISDAVCKRFVELTKFDFEEDLSVNILGHIFEQSISDLERLKSFSDGKEIETGKNETKRKKDGIFYTPEYIVDYIVKNSLGKLLEEKEKAILDKYNLDDKRNKEAGYNKKIIQAYTEYTKFLRDIKILDPACGSGAFLVKVFDYLLAEHKRVLRIIADAEGRGIGIALLSEDQLIKPILENNIFGVDLNPESVEITKLSLWLKSAQKGQKLTTLKNNIKCGNSLIDDPEVSKDRAFKWADEFSDIMTSGGFDIIVGNPPYVQLSKVLTTTDLEKTYLLNRYNTSGGRLNTFIFFIHLADTLIKQNGYISFIIPNTLLTQEYYKDTRKLLVENLSLSQVVTYPHMPFTDAVVENITLLVRKSKLDKIDILQQTSENVEAIGQILALDINEKNKYLIDIRNNAICKKIDLLGFEPLDAIVNINQAIALKGDKSLSVKNNYKDGYYKLIDGRNINRYSLVWTGEYLEYDLERIHSCKTKDIFLQPKLLFRRVSADLIFTYDDEDYFALNTIVVITPKQNKSVNLKALLAVMNSSVINYYYVNKYKSTKKVFSEIQARTVGVLPIPIISVELNEKLSDLANRQLSLNKEFALILGKSCELLRHELSLEKLPTKLNNFYELTFDEVVQISKTKLVLEKKSDLLDFFTKQKEELSKLKNEIRSIDQEIDSIVYKIYELGGNEIATINNFKHSLSKQ